MIMNVLFLAINAIWSVKDASITIELKPAVPRSDFYSIIFKFADQKIPQGRLDSLISDNHLIPGFQGVELIFNNIFKAVESHKGKCRILHVDAPEIHTAITIEMPKYPAVSK